MTTTTTKLALHGGAPAVTQDAGNIFTWPIVTKEDEEAILEVVRHGNMSGTDITKAFEREFAAWIGMRLALGYCNGTASLHAAMWACGVGAGDEVICPSMTYWASCTSALSLGAAVNFANIDPQTLCINPAISNIASAHAPKSSWSCIMPATRRPWMKLWPSPAGMASWSSKTSPMPMAGAIKAGCWAPSAISAP